MGDLIASVGDSIRGGVIGVYKVPAVNESGRHLMDDNEEMELITGSI